MTRFVLVHTETIARGKISAAVAVGNCRASPAFKRLLLRYAYYRLGKSDRQQHYQNLLTSDRMQQTIRNWGLGAMLVAILSGAFLLQPLLSHADTAVSMTDNAFSQQNITVSPGTTVTWTNNGTHQHTVTADDGSFGSPPL